MKNWEMGFLWVDFTEHPYIDIRKQKANSFDVSTKAYPDCDPDFRKYDDPDFKRRYIFDQPFDQKNYCICLLRTMVENSSFNGRCFRKI